ncbi:MAG: CocE/NonD family hydrolase [Alphaproteobacteria bacterium]|nr:CocE/NonD family hydrolase [Alphaproteobacteria bacterium]
MRALLALVALTLPACRHNGSAIQRYQSFYLQKASDLPRPEARASVATVRVPMSDGVALEADLLRLPGDAARPVVLIRTPYARGYLLPIADVFASQGYSVLVQDCRGTGDSEGEFVVMLNEQRDGLDTLAWIDAQPWAGADVFMFGPSYMGYTQLAAAVAAPPNLRALVAPETSAELYQELYRTGALNLDLALTWSSFLRTLTHGKVPIAEALALQKGWADLPWGARPLTTLDTEAWGETLPYYQDFVTRTDAADPYWVETDHLAHVGQATAPAWLATGWHDFALEGTLAIYAGQRAAGLEPALTIGGGAHGDHDGLTEAIGAAFAWFEAHATEPLGLDLPDRSAPVRYLVQGAEVWREAAAWPPPSRPQTVFLQGGGALGSAASGEATPWTYDPADPTPAVGGAFLLGFDPVADNAPLLAREDVRAFTGPVLDAPLEVAGVPRVSACFGSDQESADLFVRLSRVDKRGRSWNLTEGLQRVHGLGGAPAPVAFDLKPTAFRLAPGERLQVIVSSGAAPIWAPNTGAGELAAQATDNTLRVAHQRLEHDAACPTTVTLPVTE